MENDFMLIILLLLASYTAATLFITYYYELRYLIHVFWKNLMNKLKIKKYS